MGITNYWEKIYLTKIPFEVSWYQDYPGLSLELIEQTGVGCSARIIDVGGGASTLVDNLLEEGYQNIAVLDISATSLAIAQARLGKQAERVSWLTGDIREPALPPQQFDLWHDRAVFHFLTEAADREKYLATVRQWVKPGGYLIIATFGPEGPQQCSGLPVRRYQAQELQAEFGDEFEMICHTGEVHQTPSGSAQQFTYCCLRRKIS